MFDSLLNRLRGEPSVVIGALATGLIFLATQLDIVIDRAALELVLAPLVTAVLIRTQVSPAAKQ